MRPKRPLSYQRLADMHVSGSLTDADGVSASLTASVAWQATPDRYKNRSKNKHASNLYKMACAHAQPGNSAPLLNIAVQFDRLATPPSGRRLLV